MQSSFSDLILFGFAVAILVAKCKVSKKSKTCTLVEPVVIKGDNGWLDSQGVESEKGKVILFKRVSSDFKTQENTKNETTWMIDATLDHPAWSPTEAEGGEGKFHACSRPYFCDEFRSASGDRYIAISIAMQDLHAWDGGNYPHKIAFKKGTVLFECDRYGAKIKSK